MKLYVSFLYLLGQITVSFTFLYHDQSCHFSWAGCGQHELLSAQRGSYHEDEPSQEEDDGAESKDKVFYS